MKNPKIKMYGYALLALAFVVVCLKGCAFVGSMSYSEGERTGTIQKFSHKGMFMRTWEGELSKGGLDVGGVSSVWAFSVEDPAVVEKIHQAQRSGGRWTLKYRQQLLRQSWRGDTKYFVTDVIQAGKE